VFLESLKLLGQGPGFGKGKITAQLTRRFYHQFPQAKVLINEDKLQAGIKPFQHLHYIQELVYRAREIIDIARNGRIYQLAYHRAELLDVNKGPPLMAIALNGKAIAKLGVKHKAVDHRIEAHGAVVSVHIATAQDEGPVLLYQALDMLFRSLLGNTIKSLGLEGAIFRNRLTGGAVHRGTAQEYEAGQAHLLCSVHQLRGTPVIYLLILVSIRISKGSGYVGGKVIYQVYALKLLTEGAGVQQITRNKADLFVAGKGLSQKEVILPPG